VLKATDNKAYHLHEPSFDGGDKDYLMRCIDSGFVSSVGKFIDEFEERLADFLGAERVVACVNGTAALQLCLAVAGVEKGDEVLMPSLTFIATANAASYLGATPHFVEVEEHSLSVCPDKLKAYLKSISEIKDSKCYNKKSGQKISALMMMHCFGHIGRYDELKEVCETFKIELIEDAAEALGSEYKSKKAGTLSRLAGISFNGNKIITTGGGGVVVTNDAALGKRLKHISTTAKIPHKYRFQHDEIGYNFRMPNLNAALGLAQLDKIETYLEQKRNLARKYSEAFSDCSYAEFGLESKDCKSNYWLNYIKLNKPTDLEEIIPFLHKQKLFVRPIWEPLHQLPMYSSCPRTDLKLTEDLNNRILCLPSSPFLSGTQ